MKRQYCLKNFFHLKFVERVGWLLPSTMLMIFICSDLMASECLLCWFLSTTSASARGWSLFFLTAVFPRHSGLQPPLLHLPSEAHLSVEVILLKKEQLYHQEWVGMEESMGVGFIRCSAGKPTTALSHAWGWLRVAPLALAAHWTGCAKRCA